MKPLVIVACGRAKNDHEVPARYLYVGTYAAACGRYGEQLARDLGGEWRILSAKYGIVDPYELLEPYDVTFGDKDAVTIEQLREQVPALGGPHRRVLVVGGQRYVDVVRQLWDDAERAIAETRGIGHQLAWLSRHTRR